MLGGERIAIDVEIEEEARFQPQDIPLNIVYEDDDIIVINKPRDLVGTSWRGQPLTVLLLNALLHYYPPIADVPRAGIVHRLDKDTTGLMVVAKTIPGANPAGGVAAAAAMITVNTKRWRSVI
ncbi:23S rRNA pseudouridine synthase D [Klebsiella pneumoniae subsp. ozaenae]|uniref:23S rRNA pseudouridine synthase D n=1 Tax=Klebsiella pneumoniae subsp. ozaenae TaxID=574 RepID=A0A377ZB39_KLEPO|nr:23S rRNA pseudouridine synthase D [Klebsiella pneumoniae subsp. ozaenae]